MYSILFYLPVANDTKTTSAKTGIFIIIRYKMDNFDALLNSFR